MTEKLVFLDSAQRILSLEFEHASNRKHPAFYEMFPIIVPNSFSINKLVFYYFGNVSNSNGNVSKSIGKKC